MKFDKTIQYFLIQTSLLITEVEFLLSQIATFEQIDSGIVTDLENSLDELKDQYESIVSMGNIYEIV